jgi:hypothetical protein
MRILCIVDVKNVRHLFAKINRRIQNQLHTVESNMLLLDQDIWYLKNRTES